MGLLAGSDCLGATPALAGNAPPTAEKILAAYAKAIGGTAVAKVKTMSVEFRFSNGSLPQPVEGQAFVEPPDKSYFVIRLASFGVPDFQMGVSGDVAWRSSPDKGYQLLEGDERRVSLRSTKINPFEGWQKVWRQAETTGVETVGGAPCDKVVLTPAEGQPLVACFDRKTGLLVQETISQPETTPVPIVTTYSDYRPVGPLRVAHRMEQTGANTWVIEYTSVRLDAAVPAARFELPAEVKNLLESKKAAAAAEPRRSVELGEIREVSSKITHRDYELIVNLPYSYAQDKSKRYPVVYFTDGFYDFPLLAMIYGEQIYDKTIGECFLVGFSYKGKNPDYEALRMHDYTPTRPAQYGRGGGAQQFLEVVEKELIPFVEANYRVDPSWRAIGGSSLGGLFALYAMFERPQLWSAVMAISPAAAWDDDWLFKREEAFHARTQALPVSLYLTGAEKELPQQPQFLEAIKRFDQVLKARHYEGLRYQFRLLDDAHHSGSKPEGYARAMKFSFAPRLGQ